MRVVFEILKIVQRQDDIVDYESLIFHVESPKRLDFETSRDMWVFLKTIIDGGAKKLIFDLKGLDIIDSSGMGVLINAAKLVRVKKGDLILSNVSAEIKKVFKIINLQEFIKTFNTEGEALNFFRYL